MLKYALTIVTILALFTSCSNSSPSTTVSEPASVEEIIERAKNAMSEIASYKIRYEQHVEDSTQRSLPDSTTQIEWQSPNRYRSVRTIEETRFYPGYFQESIIIGNESFVRGTDMDWTQPSEPQGIAAQYSQAIHSAHLTILEAPDFTLIDRDAVASDGTSVFHLEFETSPFAAQFEELFEELNADSPAPEYPKWEPSTNYTLYIDRSTYLIHSFVTESEIDIIADPARGMLSTSQDHQQYRLDTQYYYDYDVPNSIEEPVVVN